MKIFLSLFLSCLAHPLIYFVGARVFFPIYDALDFYLNCYLFNPAIKCLLHAPESSNTDWFFIHSSTDKSIILQIGVFLLIWMVIHGKVTGDEEKEE